jgi:hypothetical protein
VIDTAGEGVGQSRRGWTLVLASLGLFMTELDNMVVTIALPAPWVLAQLPGDSIEAKRRPACSHTRQI